MNSKQILEPLYSQEAELSDKLLDLRTKLDAVREAIRLIKSAFESRESNDNFYKAFYASPSLEGIDNIAFSKNVEEEGYDIPPIFLNAKIRENYSDASNWPERILHTLSVVGPSTTEDIVKFISTKEPGVDSTVILNNVRGVASKLYKCGLISATKFGRSNKYSLKLNEKAPQNAGLSNDIGGEG